MTLALSGLSNGNLNDTYTYTSGSKNGKIAPQTSNLTGGETVTYKYDSLNPMIAAALRWRRRYERQLDVTTPCPTPPSPLKPGTKSMRVVVCSDERILGEGQSQ